MLAEAFDLSLRARSVPAILVTARVERTSEKTFEPPVVQPEPIRTTWARSLSPRRYLS